MKWRSSVTALNISNLSLMIILIIKGNLTYHRFWPLPLPICARLNSATCSALVGGTFPV
jgi:hypothetical protein